MLCDSLVVAAEFSESYLAVVTSDLKLWIFHQCDLTLVRALDQSVSEVMESKDKADLIQ